MSALSQVGSGYPFVKFGKLGDNVAGRIVSFEDLQDTEFETDTKRGVSKGDLKFFPSGDPIMITRIVLETAPGDPESRVTLEVKGKLMPRAVAGAFREAGRKDLQVGDDLAVVHDSMDGRAKGYSANYTANEIDDEPSF